jgi:hypothetical protein
MHIAKKPIFDITCIPSEIIEIMPDNSMLNIKRQGFKKFLILINNY